MIFESLIWLQQQKSGRQSWLWTRSITAITHQPTSLTTAAKWFLLLSSIHARRPQHSLFSPLHHISWNGRPMNAILPRCDSSNKLFLLIYLYCTSSQDFSPSEGNDGRANSCSYFVLFYINSPCIFRPFYSSRTHMRLSTSIYLYLCVSVCTYSYFTCASVFHYVFIDRFVKDIFGLFL